MYLTIYSLYLNHSESNCHQLQKQAELLYKKGFVQNMVHKKP